MKSNDITQLRIEMETKLDSETRKLEELKEYVEKNRHTTENLSEVLKEMGKYITNIENKITILPHYIRDDNHQRNIKKTLAALDNYFVALEVERIVRNGPGPCEEDQNKFVAALQRLQEAHKYLKKYNPQSVEYANISSLLLSVTNSLTEKFKVLLLKSSRPLSPNELLNCDASNRSLCVDISSGSLLNPFPAHLTAMADCLASHHNFDFIRSYKEIRAVILMLSYKNVTSQHPVGRGVNVLDSVDPSSGLVQDTGEVDSQEMESFLTCMMALQKLMEIEQSLMMRIIPSQHHNRVFQDIVSEALNSIEKDGLEIAARVESSIFSNGFGVVSVLLPAFSWLLSMRPKFTEIFEGCEDKVRFQFTTILKRFRKTIAKALDYKISENVKSDTCLGLPKVHDTTDSVLKFLSNLREHTDIIADILRDNSEYKNSPLIQTCYNRKNDKNRAVLGVYIRNSLLELNLFLSLKSNEYSDKGLSALFRLINCQHILKELMQSHLLELVHLSQPDYLDTYVDLMSTYKKSYRQCWNTALSYIVDDDRVLITDGKLQNKDRSVVRQMFSGFNEEMEEVFCTQSKCLVEDKELSDGLRRENRGYVLPIYKAFYDKFSNLTFDKHPEKFVKYTPNEFDKILQQFFIIAETSV